MYRRGGEHVEKFREGVDGILRVDGYAGYNRLIGPGRMGGALLRPAFCWSRCCCSAWLLGADEQGNPLRSIRTEGSKERAV